MRYKLILFTLVFGLLIAGASASILDLDRQQRLLYGHVMRIDTIGTEPSEIAPGGKGIINITIRNAGETEIKDIVVKMVPPSGISFLDDVSKRKIPTLQGGSSQDLSFNIILSPEMTEGVYSSYITIDYLNKIGDQKQDNDTFAIVIKSEPRIFIKIDESEIYKGKGLGEVTITFVNNNIGDIKFLAVELQESGDYDIISTNRMYIGDLDSDDFESVDFNLKLINEKDNIALPLRLTYKDSINNDYEEEVSVDLRVREDGNGGISTLTIVISVLIVLGIVYFIYRKIKKGKRDYAKDGFHIGNKRK